MANTPTSSDNVSPKATPRLHQAAADHHTQAAQEHKAAATNAVKGYASQHAHAGADPKK